MPSSIQTGQRGSSPCTINVSGDIHDLQIMLQCTVHWTTPISTMQCHTGPLNGHYGGWVHACGCVCCVLGHNTVYSTGSFQQNMSLMEGTTWHYVPEGRATLLEVSLQPSGSDTKLRGKILYASNLAQGF